MSNNKHTGGAVGFESEGEHFRTTSRATEENSPILRAIARRKAERQALLSALQGCVEHMEWSTPQGKDAYSTAIAAIATATGEKS